MPGPSLLMQGNQKTERMEEEKAIEGGISLVMYEHLRTFHGLHSETYTVQSLSYMYGCTMTIFSVWYLYHSSLSQRKY